MKPIIRQRLVGAVVLIALGAILWPLVFVDAERRTMDRQPQVPPMPDILSAMDETPLPDPQPLEGLQPPSSPESMALRDGPPEALDADDEAVSAEPGSPAAPALDDEGIAIAWELRVISVREKSRADDLTAQLIHDGYKAYNRAHKQNSGIVYQVSIGPVFDRARLGSIKQAVDEKLQVDAIVTRYFP